MRIKKITIENALSFGEGDDKLEIELGDINFIVGPNNSGKSNVMRVTYHFRKNLEVLGYGK
jgi:AAA15 family ATPase/GTPase